MLGNCGRRGCLVGRACSQFVGRTAEFLGNRQSSCLAQPFILVAGAIEGPMCNCVLDRQNVQCDSLGILSRQPVGMANHARFGFARGDLPVAPHFMRGWNVGGCLRRWFGWGGGLDR